MTAPLDRLRPALRTSAELAPTDGPEVYLTRPAGMLLVEAIWIKDAYEPRLVEQRDLRQWGLTPDAAFDAAHAAYTDERRAFLMEPTPYGSQVVRNTQPERNATTWALNPDFVRGMMPPHPSRPGPDDPLVFAPEPDTMFIARSSNAAEAGAALRTALDVYEASSHRTAPCAFAPGADGALQPWAPGPQMPVEVRDAQAGALARYVVDTYNVAVDAFAATPESRKFAKSQQWSFTRPALLDPATPGVTFRQLNWNTSQRVLVPTYATVEFQPHKADPVRASVVQLAQADPSLLGGFLLDPSWVVLTRFPAQAQLDALRGAASA